jgi:hypothetical protein
VGVNSKMSLTGMVPHFKSIAWCVPRLITIRNTHHAVGTSRQYSRMSIW